MMKVMNLEPDNFLLQQNQIINRRREVRMSAQLGLIFSGVVDGRLMMGDGHVIDLSRDGIGIRGDRVLRRGLELALFIELPDAEDHLCIPEARVSWVSGRRFGVALRTLRREGQNRLRFLLMGIQSGRWA
jgi:hypothetical protein